MINMPALWKRQVGDRKVNSPSLHTTQLLPCLLNTRELAHSKNLN